MSIITSLGFAQFSQPLSATENPGNHNLTVSHVTPFGARLDIEVLLTPQPLSKEGKSVGDGGETKYIRFKLNERTLPHPRCPWRIDGLCEMLTLIEILKDEETKAVYEHACFGDYEAVPHGQLRDGRPENS